jgi:hypothetical protein
MVCEKEFKQDSAGPPNQKLCEQCWLDFRYCIKEDKEYKDYNAVDEEYNRIGLWDPRFDG